MKRLTQGNINVFGVYVVIGQYPDSYKQTRLNMLGVIEAEHISRCWFPAYYVK